MARVLVLGYGNPLRSDDGLGWQVAVQLFRANASPDVEVLPCHQLTPELAEPVSRAEVVLFVDCRRNGNPGEFYCEELCPESGPVAFTHHISPAALLDLSSELYGACPKAYLVSICGESFETGDAFPLRRAGTAGIKSAAASLDHRCPRGVDGSTLARSERRLE